MNNTFRKLFGAILLMVAFPLFFHGEAFSQENKCLDKLKKAQELFESGLIEEIPSMLDSCLKHGFDKEQTIQAYRLLIQVYLFDYNQEKSEKTMLALLSYFPEYEIQVNDPVEFVNLYKQFQTKPRYSFSVNTGLNLSDISVVEQYSTGNLNNLDAKYTAGGVKAGVRLSFEKYISSKAWITLGAGYSFSGYEVEEKMNFNREMLSFTEKMQFLQVPLYFNLSFGKSKIYTPYLFAGGSFNYLIKSEGELNRRSLEDAPATTDLSGVARDITNTRVREGYSVLGGMGFRYKISSGYLRINIYYSRGLNEYVKPSSRFSNNENLFYYNHIDDNIRLSSYNLTVGYSYIFYKTQKKKSSENL